MESTEEQRTARDTEEGRFPQYLWLLSVPLYPPRFSRTCMRPVLLAHLVLSSVIHVAARHSSYCFATPSRGPFARPKTSPGQTPPFPTVAARMRFVPSSPPGTTLLVWAGPGERASRGWGRGAPDHGGSAPTTRRAARS